MVMEPSVTFLQNNINSANALTNLNANESTLRILIQKLSSGIRLSCVDDDART